MVPAIPLDCRGAVAMAVHAAPPVGDTAAAADTAAAHVPESAPANEPAPMLVAWSAAEGIAGVPVPVEDTPSANETAAAADVATAAVVAADADNKASADVWVYPRAVEARAA